jgi:hypothetical protein
MCDVTRTAAQRSVDDDSLIDFARTMLVLTCSKRTLVLRAGLMVDERVEEPADDRSDRDRCAVVRDGMNRSFFAANHELYLQRF